MSHAIFKLEKNLKCFSQPKNLYPLPTLCEKFFSVPAQKRMFWCLWKILVRIGRNRVGIALLSRSLLAMLTLIFLSRFPGTITYTCEGVERGAWGFVDKSDLTKAFDTVWHRLNVERFLSKKISFFSVVWYKSNPPSLPPSFCLHLKARGPCWLLLMDDQAFWGPLRRCEKTTVPTHLGRYSSEFLFLIHIREGAANLKLEKT